MSDAARVADATGNWVDTRAPSWSRPYLRLSRLDRPIGSWLLLMPCWWSAALAAAVAHDIRQLPLVIPAFFVGAFVMRGAGCTWNDITDRDLVAWVVGYGTIYAHQDAEDDALIGIKSTARLFGARTHRALVVFYTLAVVLIGAALWLAGVGWPGWIGLAAFAAHLAWQIRRLDIG